MNKKSLVKTTTRAVGSKLVIAMITAAFSLVWVQPAISQPYEVIYEPFDYDTGALAGQDGGIGFEGAWSSGGEDNHYAVTSPGLSFGELPVAGNRVRRPSAPQGAQSSRAISATSQAALTADNTTIWFSILLGDERFSTPNENGTFALASGAFSSGGSDSGGLPNVPGGNGFGVTTRVLSDEFRIYAYRIVDGTRERTSDYYEGSTTAGGTYLVAGKIAWGEHHEGHTLHLFNITDPLAEEPPEDEEAFAFFEADFDQSTLNTLAIGNRQISSVDEIRFATSFYGAMGREVPPPAGTLMIIK